MFRLFKNTSIIIFIFLWFVPFSNHTFSQEQESKELKWAKSFYDDGNYTAAIKLLEEFLSANEDNREKMKNEFCQAYYLLSKTYFSTEAYENMEKNFVKLFNLNPDYAFSEDEDLDFLQKASEAKDAAEGLITIVLKDGKEAKGKFLFVDADSVTIETNFGTETIKKAFILETKPSLEAFEPEKEKKEEKEKPKKLETERKEMPVITEKEVTPVSFEDAIPHKVDGYRRFNVFLQGNYINTLNVSDSNYERMWESVNVDGEEQGNILSELSSGISLSGGLTYFLYKNIGISLSFSYFKQNVDLASDYEFSWIFWNNKSGDRSQTWENKGSISSMPISLDLIYALNINDRSAINLFGGLALYLTKIELNSHTGYSDYLLSGGQIYVDWFDFENKIEEKDNFVGGKFGASYEYKIMSNFGLFIGFHYFYAPKKEYIWEMIPKSQYRGELDNLNLNQTPEIDEMKTEINFSFYQALLGIKIYF